MSEVAIADVVARLDKLERENKRLKRCGAIAILLGVALLVMAQAPARTRTLEAERLIIRYPNGKEAIVLSAADAVGDMKAGAGAIFYRPDHSMGATIKVVEDAGFVQVVSPNKGIDLGMSARGSSTFETGAFTIHHQDSPR